MANQNKNTSKPLENDLTSYEKIKSEVQANQAMNKLLRERVDYLKQLVLSGQQLSQQQQEFYKNASKSLKEEKKRIDSIREESRIYKELDGLASDFTKGIGKLPGVMNAVNKKIEVTKQGVGVMSDTIRDARDMTKDQKKYAQQSISTYVKLTSSIAKSQKALKKGEITVSEYNKSVIDISDSFDEVISQIDKSTKSGKKLVKQLRDAKKESDDFVSSAKKSVDRMNQLNGAMDQLGSSGIPLMNDLSGVVKDLANKDLKAAQIGFTALGAAAGALLSKIIPGLAQMNAKLKAGNDIIESQIELKRQLAELSVEAQFIPEQIIQERLSNAVETANDINRAMIDAQYAAQRAAISFNTSLLSGAAQFKAAAKTALSGGQLGAVRYSVSQLQLAGISAEEIANSMNEVSGLMGKMPSSQVASDISVFAKQAGVGAEEVSQIADSMNLIDGYSLETSLNLQNGIKQMAKKTGLSFSKLMKGVAGSSKKMFEYGIMNSKQLVKQVAYAQSIGTDFNAIADAGRNMVLNYKDSIKAEMTLSAILGKQVDFSEVRQRFFEGDQKGAIEALKSQGITAQDLRSPFAQEAIKSALGGMDIETILKSIERNGKESGELQAKNITSGNKDFLNRFEQSQRQLSAEEATISANQAIIDAELSGKITDAYLSSPGYLKYQQSLNTLQQSQAKLNQAIQEAFMKSKAYTDNLVELEKLSVRRGFTENLVPTLGAIGGGALFNYLGGKMFGGGTTEGTTGSTSFLSKAASGTNLAFGNVAGAGFGSNLSGALKSGGTITGGVISGLTSGFMEFSENKQLGLSMGENIGRTTTKAISAGVGGWGGASLGAAIGTAIFPGVGTLVGGLLGGWLGGKGGDALGGAINDGIWGDKQRKQLQIQQNMEAAQEKLQKDTSMGIQVDVDYYKKSLKLNQDQINQLQQYNKQAVSAEWLKNPPAWYTKSGGRDTTAETYSGSGIRLLSGTYAGDPNVAKYGVDVKYDQFGKVTTSIIKEQEYLDRLFKETGERLTKSQLSKRVSSGQQYYTAQDPIIQRLLTSGTAVKPEYAAQMAIKDVKDPDWKKKEETKLFNDIMSTSKEFMRIGQDNMKYNKIYLEPYNQLKTYANSPALSVSLWGDNIDLIKTLKELIYTVISETRLQTSLMNINTTTSRISSLSFPLFGSSLRGFAKGKSGKNSGGMAMVGERGPELMYVPHNSSIVPNGDTRRIQSGDVSRLSKWGIPGYEGGKNGEHHSPDVLGFFNTIASGGALLPLIHYIGHHAAETDSQKQQSLISKFLQSREAINLLYDRHHTKKWFGDLISKQQNLKEIWTIGKHFLGTGGALKYTGKALLKEWVSMGLAPGVLAAQGLGSLVMGYGSAKIQSEGLGGETATTSRNVGNYAASVGASMYDMIDDWFLFGLGNKLLGQTSGLTLPGFNGSDTQLLRGLYWTSHPDANQNIVTNNDLLEWVAANDVNTFTGPSREIVAKAQKLAKKLGITPSNLSVAEASINKDYKQKIAAARIAAYNKIYGIQSFEDKLKEDMSISNVMSTERQPGISAQSQFGSTGALISKTGQKSAQYNKLLKKSTAQIKDETSKKKAETKAKIEAENTQQLSSIIQTGGQHLYEQNLKLFQGASKFASGTHFAPGGVSLVGERGPELVNLPRGSEVIPNHKLSSYANGTIGATSALLASNNAQIEQLATKIASAIANGQSQNINLIVDGRQLNNIQYRRQQNRIGARPNDLV